MRSVPLLLLLASAFVPPPPHPTPPQIVPAAGRFLVATPQIRGSVFTESVVILLDYSAEGAIGLIVNRPTETPVEELFPGVGPAVGRLHVGGPVEPRTVRALLRAPVPPEQGRQVSGDVFLTRDESALREVAALPDAARRLRVYVGYAGWGAGQLDREIAVGSWLVARAPPDPIFDAAPDELWERLFREHRGLVTRAPVRLAFR